MDPETGETAVYSVHGALMANRASGAMVSFAMDNFVELFRWSDVRGPMRPSRLADWMTRDTAERCILFSLRDLYTPTQTVIKTPDV